MPPLIPKLQLVPVAFNYCARVCAMDWYKSVHIPSPLPVQYGFVNSALEKLIKRRFGVEKWEEIR